MKNATTHSIIEADFQTENEAVEAVLTTQVSRLKPTNGRFPVCVKTELSSKKVIYGTQFWTAEMIKNGESENHDGSISILC